MKMKTETSKEITAPAQKADVPKSQLQTETKEEAYFEINSYSFQKNFKALISHYKKEASSAKN